MRYIYVALLLTVLSLTSSRVALAAIACTPSTCQTITQTASGGQVIGTYIPLGVTALSFYAQGGAGGSSGGRGGGGGAPFRLHRPSRRAHHFLAKDF